MSFSDTSGMNSQLCILLQEYTQFHTFNLVQWCCNISFCHCLHWNSLLTNYWFEIMVHIVDILVCYVSWKDDRKDDCKGYSNRRHKQFSSFYSLMLLFWVLGINGLLVYIAPWWPKKKIILKRCIILVNLQHTSIFVTPLSSF